LENFSWETLSDAVHRWNEELKRSLPPDCLRPFEWMNSVEYFIETRANPLLSRLEVGDYARAIPELESTLEEANVREKQTS
jgi:hypothetical protein